MRNKHSESSEILDQIALALSGVCLLHCLALPLLVAGLPLLAGTGSLHFHLQMFAAVLPVSLLAFALGYRRHRNLRIIASGAVGLLLLMAGAAAHGSYGASADTGFTVAGALALATAHYLNARLARGRFANRASRTI